MELFENLAARAKTNKQRIVPPESLEERTLKAADAVIADNIADIILIGNSDEILAKGKALGLGNLQKATFFDPATDKEQAETYCNLLYELRKHKGMTEERARELAINNPLYTASLMVKNHDADGEVGGAINATSNVLRPALQIIKMKPGISVVSGAFLMAVPLKQYGSNGVLLFADCAVTPNPTAEQLAQIAVVSASTARTLGGFEPRIAMLSFSTKGSASHECVEKVQQATEMAKQLAPDLIIDGEFQADAALVPEVGKSKAHGSIIQGDANVLIFPNLDAGNIGYKLVQRLAGGMAIGPILQGMASPVNDLSRGCNVDDIIKMIIITANQAIG